MGQNKLWGYGNLFLKFENRTAVDADQKLKCWFLESKPWYDKLDENGNEKQEEDDE